MAKLTTKKRDEMPKGEFGLPGKRAYPMPDKSHAANAKSRASQMATAGKLSETAKENIYAKANKMLGEDGEKMKRNMSPRDNMRRMGAGRVRVMGN